MRKQLLFITLLVSLFTLPLSVQARDELVFSTIASANPYDTEALYTPLVNFLSRATGKAIVLDVSSNVVEHAVHMRLNKFDIVFDDAHFAAWRIKKKGHVPLVRAQGDYRIVVVANAHAREQSKDGVLGEHHRVCALDSPAMATMAFLAYFPNPLLQPFLIHANDDADAMQCLRRERGDLAVLEASTWEFTDKQGLKLVPMDGRAYPQQTMTAGPAVDTSTRQALTAAMLSDEGQRLAKAIISKLGSQSLVQAEQAEYDGIENLLNSVWGFY